MEFQSTVEKQGFTLHRQPKGLQDLFRQPVLAAPIRSYIQPNEIYHGDARSLLPRVEPNSVALSVWSPPYFVGKEYEAGLSFDDWKALISETIRLHFQVLKPGGFLVVNISDILCFKDPSLPRIQAEVLNCRKVAVTKEDIIAVLSKKPNAKRHELAKILNCSEQTIDRRLNGNNVRGGKYSAQTRIRIVGGLVEEWALSAGLIPYDRRVWVKDAAWENSKWFSLSYRAVDEFEYLYFFWKPGPLKIDRTRLTQAEWRDWGSRGVWTFPSVRANDDHEAKFPLELPMRTIRLLTEPGEIVLDSFSGSGTTALAAIKTKRSFIGIELLESYVSLSKQKISQALTQEELFVS